MVDSEKPTRDKRRAARSEAQWRLSIIDWKRGDLSLSQYCETHQLHPRTLKNWLTKLGEGPGRGHQLHGTTAAAGETKTRLFAPVQVRQPAAVAPVLSELTATVLLAGGRRVQLTGGLCMEQLGQLLDAVEGAVSC